MSASQVLRSIPRFPQCLWRILQAFVHSIPDAVGFWLTNRLESRPCTQLYGPVVSLTTYGMRASTVYLTIESIARGTMLPSRLILWVDEASVMKNPPSTLRRLMKRGLEILLCENYGPHKKYYPYVSSQKSFDAPLVTADDDVIYPKYWLKELFGAYLANAGVISCFRARVVAAESREKLADYNRWSFCRSNTPRFEHIATGVSGIIYPPPFLARLKEAGLGFISCCPRADDIWIHVQAIRAGFAIRQVRSDPLCFLETPLSQGKALWKTNMAGQNDIQIEATYAARDVAQLYSQLELSRGDVSSAA